MATKRVSRCADRVALSPLRGAPSGTSVSPVGTAQQAQSPISPTIQHNLITKCQLLKGTRHYEEEFLLILTKSNQKKRRRHRPHP